MTIDTWMCVWIGIVISPCIALVGIWITVGHSLDWLWNHEQAQQRRGYHRWQQGYNGHTWVEERWCGSFNSQTHLKKKHNFEIFTLVLDSQEKTSSVPLGITIAAVFIRIQQSIYLSKIFSKYLDVLNAGLLLVYKKPILEKASCIRTKETWEVQVLGASPCPCSPVPRHGREPLMLKGDTPVPSLPAFTTTSASNY